MSSPEARMSPQEQVKRPRQRTAKSSSTLRGDLLELRKDMYHLKSTISQSERNVLAAIDKRHKEMLEAIQCARLARSNGK